MFQFNVLLYKTDRYIQFYCRFLSFTPMEQQKILTWRFGLESFVGVKCKLISLQPHFTPAKDSSLKCQYLLLLQQCKTHGRQRWNSWAAKAAPIFGQTIMSMPSGVQETCVGNYARKSTNYICLYIYFYFSYIYIYMLVSENYV